MDGAGDHEDAREAQRPSDPGWLAVGIRREHKESNRATDDPKPRVETTIPCLAPRLGRCGGFVVQPLARLHAISGFRFDHAANDFPAAATPPLQLMATCIPAAPPSSVTYSRITFR